MLSNEIRAAEETDQAVQDSVRQYQKVSGKEGGGGEAEDPGREKKERGKAHEHMEASTTEARISLLRRNPTPLNVFRITIVVLPFYIAFSFCVAVHTWNYFSFDFYRTS